MHEETKHTKKESTQPTHKNMLHESANWKGFSDEELVLRYYQFQKNQKCERNILQFLVYRVQQFPEPAKRKDLTDEKQFKYITILNKVSDILIEKAEKLEHKTAKET